MIEKETNKLENISNRKYHKLSIQVSLNGLSFCIVDTVSNSILNLDSVDFEEERTTFGLQKGLVHLLEKHKITNQSFSEVIVIHRNKLFSLVPKSLFDETQMPNYLKFNTKILANDHIAHDELEGYDMVNVYVPFANVNNYIYDLFGPFTFKHSGTVMVSSLLGSQIQSRVPNCFVHIAHKHMEVTVVSRNKLILYNSFDFYSKEDFIYYLLFTFEQLNLSPEKTKLMLFGDIEEDDTIYNICYQYVKHVSIFVPSISAYPMDFEKDAIDFTVLNTL